MTQSDPNFVARGIEFDRRTVLRAIGAGGVIGTVGAGGLTTITDRGVAGLGTGLAAHYHLNNLKGRGRVKTEVHDTSTNDNDGTANGDIAPVDGKVGNGFEFDGAGDYVEVPDDDSLDFERTDPFSIGMWVKFNEIGTDTNEMLLAKRTNVPGEYSGYLLWKDSGDRIQLQLQHNTNNRLRVATQSAGTVNENFYLNNDDWFHITARYDGSSMPSGIDIFIDGIPQSLVTVENSLTDSITHDDPLRIGQQQESNPLSFDGTMDDVYIFNRVLSDGEVCQLVLRGVADEMVAHYPLEDLADLDGDSEIDDVEDLSEYANHGIWTDYLVHDTPETTGQVGNAFDFDGVDDEVRVPDAPHLRPGNASWTVAFWANPENAAQDAAVVSKRQPSAPVPMYLIGFNATAFAAPREAGKRLAFRYAENAQSIDRGVYTANEVIDGNWHHFVAVADKSADELRLYVDGEQAAVTTQIDQGGWPNITNTDDLYLGQDNAGGRRYDGLLDDVRIFNRVLPSSEIAGLYHCQS